MHFTMDKYVGLRHILIRNYTNFRVKMYQTYFPKFRIFTVLLSLFKTNKQDL